MLAKADEHASGVELYLADWLSVGVADCAKFAEVRDLHLPVVRVAMTIAYGVLLGKNQSQMVGFCSLSSKTVLPS